MSAIENRFTNILKPSTGKWMTRFFWFIGGAVVTSGVIVLLYFSGVLGPRPNSDGWQAVFLTNGQVYFGKLQSVHGRYVTLTDIFYLQVSQPLQQPDNADNAQQPNLNLIKLGDELHGPEDAMYIERKNIMFWENLKSSSNVVRAIEEAR